MRKDALVWEATVHSVFNQRKAKGWYVEGATYKNLSQRERENIKDEARVIYMRRIGV